MADKKNIINNELEKYFKKTIILLDNFVDMENPHKFNKLSLDLLHYTNNLNNLQLKSEIHTTKRLTKDILKLIDLLKLFEKMNNSPYKSNSISILQSFVNTEIKDDIDFNMFINIKGIYYEINVKLFVNKFSKFKSYPLCPPVIKFIKPFIHCYIDKNGLYNSNRIMSMYSPLEPLDFLLLELYLEINDEKDTTFHYESCKFDPIEKMKLYEKAINCANKFEEIYEFPNKKRKL